MALGGRGKHAHFIGLLQLPDKPLDCIDYVTFTIYDETNWFQNTGFCRIFATGVNHFQITWHCTKMYIV